MPAREVRSSASSTPLRAAIDLRAGGHGAGVGVGGTGSERGLHGREGEVVHDGPRYPTRAVPCASGRR